VHLSGGDWLTWTLSQQPWYRTHWHLRYDNSIYLTTSQSMWVNAKGFYLLLYSKAFRTISLSPY